MVHLIAAYYILEVSTVAGQDHFALVVGHGHTQGSRHLIEFVAEVDGCLRGRGAIHFRQDHKARGAFHQRTDSRAIVGANDEIALPNG